MRKEEKWMLGMGYYVQGMRCLPWLGVSFFLKDSLCVDPSTLQLLLNSVNLPMLSKPLFGLLSDSKPNSRLLFISFAALLQAVSWLTIAIKGHSSLSVTNITIYLLLSNLGASIAEVVNDTIVAEATKQQPSSSDLQSFVWMSSSFGGLLGNLLAGLIIDRVSPQRLFLLFGALVSAQFLITAAARRSSSGPHPGAGAARFGNQLSKLKLALGEPSIGRSIVWFAASYAAIPSLAGTMFFYQTRQLKIEPSVVGYSKVFGQAAMLAWSAAYDRWLKRVPSRTVIAGVQVAMAAVTVCDVAFVGGAHRRVGVPDWLYVVTVSGLSEVLLFMKMLPFGVAVARLSPRGCEGSLMSLVSSAVAFALMVSGYFGVALAAAVGVNSGDDFSGLAKGLLVQAALTILPLFWLHWIPEDGDAKNVSPSETTFKED